MKRLNLGMKNDAETKLQGQKDLEDQTREQSKRKGKLTFVIVISRQTRDKVIKSNVGQD